MKRQSKFERLFEPGEIGTLQLKNRIIMSPMGTNFATVLGEASDDYIDWYLPRARGGAGLLFTGSGFVATAIDPLRHGPSTTRFDHDAFGPGMFKIVEAVHEAGAKGGIQLSPGLSSQARGAPWSLEQQHIAEVQPVGPSPVTHPLTQRQARELTIEEIEKIVELCGWAAERAKDVGFDIIEIHAHGAFLIGQFLSPYFNRRVDKYGGTPKRRMRFLLEIIESTRKHVGSDFPLTVRYSIAEFTEGGRDLKEGQAIARELEKVGINGISVSSGIHGAAIPSMPTMYHSEGTFIPLAEALKEVVSLPIILPGRLDNPYLAEQVLREGKADFIAWGRGLIADPELPRKVAEGRLDEIRKCIFCNECLRTVWDNKSPLRCTVNPIAGRERRYGVLQRADKLKKVVIIGAGPAGMEAARVAALRGHNVVLYEKSTELGGGQLRLASIPPHKEILKSIADYYEASFKTLTNLKVVLGKEATTEDIIKDEPDAIVVATGAEPLIPNIPGAKGSNIISAHALLSGQASAGETVVVVGGGSVGCEVANLLASLGKKVTIVEMLDTVATDVHTFVRLGLVDELSRQGVRILTGVKVDSLTDGIRLINKKGKATLLKVDTIVLALGVKSVNKLAEELYDGVKELYIIGDAKEPRRIRNAISEGYVTSFNL